MDARTNARTPRRQSWVFAGTAEPTTFLSRSPLSDWADPTALVCHLPCANLALSTTPSEGYDWKGRRAGSAAGLVSALASDQGNFLLETALPKPGAKGRSVLQVHTAQYATFVRRAKRQVPKERLARQDLAFVACSKTNPARLLTWQRSYGPTWKYRHLGHAAQSSILSHHAAASRAWVASERGKFDPSMLHVEPVKSQDLAGRSLSRCASVGTPAPKRP